MKLFIASSSVGRTIATWLEELLISIASERNEDIEIRKWFDEGVFPYSKAIYESLEVLANECDAAVMVVTPDDMRIKGNASTLIARDNVILELGLFAGRKGRESALIACAGKVTLPSDLNGIKRLDFEKLENAADFKTHTRSNVTAWLEQVRAR